MSLFSLIDTLSLQANPQQASKMRAYLREQFDFLGIRTRQIHDLCKEPFKVAKQQQQIDWDFVDCCWQNQYRELQQIAIGYLMVMQPYLLPQDLNKLKQLVITKSWWDSVDGVYVIMLKPIHNG